MANQEQLPRKVKKSDSKLQQHGAEWVTRDDGRKVLEVPYREIIQLSNEPDSKQRRRSRLLAVFNAVGMVGLSSLGLINHNQAQENNTLAEHYADVPEISQQYEQDGDRDELIRNIMIGAAATQVIAAGSFARSSANITSRMIFNTGSLEGYKKGSEAK